MHGFSIISFLLLFVIVDRIKAEARLWVLAGAKKLGTIMPGE
jgi:hypothetical protein